MSMFQSTRPARGATIRVGKAHRFAGQDSFNPRAPRGARRDAAIGNFSAHAQFQSTRPARGATCCRNPDARRLGFNPRAPRGARRVAMRNHSSRHVFQSTRPARGATLACRTVMPQMLVFQSTRPARGATRADR